jgi:hypothetical protein
MHDLEKDAFICSMVLDDKTQISKGKVTLQLKDYKVIRFIQNQLTVPVI